VRPALRDPATQRRGWFARLKRGTYGLSSEGRQALSRFAEALSALSLPA
jgi:hypothetical protein